MYLIKYTFFILLRHCRKKEPMKKQIRCLKKCMKFIQKMLLSSCTEVKNIYSFVFELLYYNIKTIFSALVVLSWKSSISDAFNYLDQALKIDSKCDYAYETLGTLYIQT